jgi:O-methyltransferase
MMGFERLHHLRACAETVLLENIPGDFIETGVWRGGACILLRGVLQAYGNFLRRVWVADSFAGLPKPNPEKYPADLGDNLHTFPELAVPLEEVRQNFSRYNLLDQQVRFLPGLFAETLPQAPIEQLALLRLDGDMYESTMDALTALYPKLSSGGFCIIDDYGCITACRKAVRDYRAANGIRDAITMIDWTGAWWRKT